MANVIVESYVDELGRKFPSCFITQAQSRGRIILTVSWSKGKEWFEVPMLFDDNISSEQFEMGKPDLMDFEREITTQLENNGVFAK